MKKRPLLVWLIGELVFLPPLFSLSDPLDIPDSELQIVNGINADISDYSWMGALVFNEENDNTRQFCACTAIDPYWVMTAAHCLDEDRELSDFKIVFGVADLNDFEAARVFEPAMMVRHPDHVGLFSRDNDIALIQLKTPLSPDIDLVHLVSSTTIEIPGLEARILGWGLTNTDFRNRISSDILQQANVSILSMDFANLPEFFNGRVTEGMISAGVFDPYTSTGSGDSGGPLLAYHPEMGRWEQIGIDSFGAGCSKPDNPISVFTKVSTHLEWIRTIINSDFLHWTTEQGIETLAESDGDLYPPIMEFLLGMDPKIADEPSWLNGSYLDLNDPLKPINLPVFHRVGKPKFGLYYERSTDLTNWQKLPLLWDSVKEDTFSESENDFYLLPVVSSSDDAGFFRLRHEAYDGLIRGPIPLSVGDTVYGIFNSGTEAEGLTRYDYLIEDLETELPIRIAVRTGHPVGVRLQVIEFETDAVIIDETRTATEDEPLISGFTVSEGKSVVMRIESTQSRITQPFAISTGLFINNAAVNPGTTFNGTLDQTNSSYKRQSHYADAHTYTLAKDVNYIIEMASDDLDPVFFLRNRGKAIPINEIDNETPGVTERFLFRPEESMDLEVIVSSWYPDDVGSYDLSLREFEETNQLAPGEKILHIVDPSDNPDTQGTNTFYITRITLTDLDTINPNTVRVSGYDGFTPYFAILDLTAQKTLYYERARCEDRNYEFIATEGSNYRLLVIGTASDIGDSFYAEIIPFSTEGSSDLSSDMSSSEKETTLESEWPEGSAYYAPTQAWYKEPLTTPLHNGSAR